MAGLFLLWVACAVEQWRAAEVQVDVSGSGLGDQDRVRVCVEGAGEHEQAVGEGRIAVTGMPVDGSLVVTVSGLAEDGGSIGGVGPLTLDSDYMSVAWWACAGCSPCEADGARVADGAPDRLLAIRFVP